MAGYSAALDRLTEAFGRLPGVGAKSAERLAHHILKCPAEEALTLARENALRLGLGDRVQFIKGNLLENLAERFDLIVANLPYIAMQDRDSLSREVLRDPEVALFGGEHGDELIRQLIEQAPPLLQLNGLLALEMGEGQSEAVAGFLAAGPLANFVHVPSAAMRAAALALVFVAVAQVYLGGSRGLKIMRHTLYAYWVGQSVGWIVLTLIAWAVIGKTVPVTVLAYAASWVLATAIAFVSWRSATAAFEPRPAEPDEALERVRS